jgi:hypothetical protein
MDRTMTGPGRKPKTTEKLSSNIVHIILIVIVIAILSLVLFAPVKLRFAFIYKGLLRQAAPSDVWNPQLAIGATTEAID